MSLYHFKALVYKNWILWYRRPLGSFCELFFPILVFIVLYWVRTQVTSDEYEAESYLNNATYVSPTQTTSVSFEFESSIPFLQCLGYVAQGEEWIVGLAPQNEITEYIEDQLGDYLRRVEVRYFEDDDAIEDYVKDSDYEDGPKLCFAVVFTEWSDNYVEYKIRFNQTDSIPDDGFAIGDYVDIFNFNDNEATNERQREPKPEFQAQFFSTGFIQIQNWVDNYLLQKYTGSTNSYIAAGFVPMYFDEWIDDDFLEYLANFLAFFIILSFGIPVCRMVTQIVEEKETKIKEMMVIMGLSGTSYWAAWILYYFFIYLAIAIGAAYILSRNFYEYSDISIIFITYFLLGLSCISFSLLLSIFFSTVKTALIFSIMIFFATFFAYFAVDDPLISTSTKYWISIIPSVAFSLGTQIMVEQERGYIGVTYDNITEELFNYKYSACIIFIAIDTVAIFLLFLYLEQVWPSEYGVKRPWNFLFKKEFWVEIPVESKDFDDRIEKNENTEEVDAILEEQKNKGKVMMIRNLTKSYDGALAVDNLSLDIYEGQIFALLGHNGAGKTTTISMLTGMINVTSGDMMVRNLLLSKDLKKIRKLLGVCPQQNIHYPELTPAEHLYLFSVFKGKTNSDEISKEINEKLEEIMLVPQKDVQVKTLSGGQKRKLSLAIALIGGSPIILLDEPTSGMDLNARRHMWEMLKNNKQERIIILTTHYMQEADTLADRIAILSHGKLRCCGSSLFLKNKFGVGYYLVLVKQSNVYSPQHSKLIIDFVEKYIPNSRLVSDVQAEISFQLPLSSSGQFNDFFQALDEKKTELEIRSYSVSVTTLEEVFINVTEKTQEIKENEENLNETRFQEGENELLVEKPKETSTLFIRHFKALLKKRILWSMRDFKTFTFEILIPMSLITIGIIFLLIADRYIDQDPWDLVIDQYDTPQNILYPDNINDYTSQLMSSLDSMEDIDTSGITAEDIEEFDLLIFENREVDPTRMGSYYYYTMNSDIDRYEPVIFHNQTAFQSLPTYYQLVALEILKTYNPDLEILVQNHPLPITEKMNEFEASISSFIITIIFGLGAAFIPASIVSFIVREKENNVKFQHMISGASMWAYWISNFIWDYAKYLVIAIYVCVLIVIVDINIYVDEDDRYAAFWLIFILYGLSVIPFTYLSSFIFTNHNTAQVITISFHFLTGSFLPIVMIFMWFFDDTRNYVREWRWFFRLFPNFCFGNGILQIASQEFIAYFDGDETEPVFSLEAAGGDILYLGATAVGYSILLIFAEWINNNRALGQFITQRLAGKPSEYLSDEDVESEKQLALITSPQDVKVNVRELRKFYGSLFGSRVIAVEEVSFNIPSQQCFCLLGSNGAGKTTVFKILAGEIIASSGEAFIGGYSINTSLTSARKCIGYCPQFDALSEKLTCKEHIRLYCDIKGINKQKIAELTKNLLRELDLEMYEDYKMENLSGGNKRKLSVAISLIGSPDVILLDEPSTGMDPETRKKLWRVLGNLKKQNSSVVLTTHSMEEAEALSDRIAIMAAGRIRCIGSSSHIRNKFGQGYELDVKIKIPKQEKIHILSKKLDLELKDATQIREFQIKKCLQALEAEDLEEVFNSKNIGFAMQLKNEGSIARDSFISWVITEKRGLKVLKWLKGEFKDVELVEHYLSSYKYRITKQDDRSLGYLFSLVEKSKKSLKISEYSISQTSLEQIFTELSSNPN
ncbi:unnamed protein product [Blepharisma stoltei]|uniref:ABC transporter domain-containing protein n=1 Tax=Blepharisma stoltei TaxID=1481888 RepID=A0AAU9KDS1_9CILI|nr:unnamed protein product [Blepharisma stoltei]